MKHNANSRRGRNRGNGKRHIPLRSQTFESSGPDGKIRGTAQQVLDRYLALGRDAYSAGDPIAAEAFYQHAEHYHRILRAEGGDDRSGGRPRQDAGGEVQTEDGNADAEPSVGETVEQGTGRVTA
jgi:NAD(P)H-flavin reductase